MGWLPLLIVAGLLVVAGVLVGGAAAVIFVFVAILLVLDRAIGFTGWGMAEAERSFARLVSERRREELKRRFRRLPPESNQLACLSEDVPPIATAGRRRLGVQPIALSSIVGTVEADKAAAFDCCFRPPRWSRGHWTRMWIAARRGMALPPISAYRIGQEHFVRDGHHRVSVMRALGALDIDAEVTELDIARPTS